MSRKQKLLHVKTYIEQVIKTCEDMLKRDDKYTGGLVLAPIDKDHLREMKLIGICILNKHKKKNTRKDIYIEQHQDPSL